jgi:hypothetical protein
MDSRELTEWMAFDLVEPIGGRRSDFQAAIIASTVANVNRGKGRVLKPDDFIPEYGATADREAELSAWLSQRVAEQQETGNDAGWQDASPGDNPNEDPDSERVRGAGGELDGARNGVG